MTAAQAIARAAARAGVCLPVRVRAWDGSEAGPEGTPVVVLRSPRALRRVLWRPGELGLARAYVSGDLDVEGDLAEGLRRGRQAIRGGRAAGPANRAGLALTAVLAARRLGAFGPPPAPPACESRHRGRPHSRARDKAVIAGHYDIPVSFYQLILDPSMAYSCAYWTRDDPGYGLADAQRDKLGMICRKLGLGEGSRLLDLGCGWGSLAVYAAGRCRARVTAVTLAAAQGRYARERLARLGLGGLAEVRVQDYRDPAGGSYDAIASVEMGEHVGAAGYPAFCAGLRDRLRPGGRVLVQQMSRGACAPGGGAFIESYVAADMHMRPVGETVSLLEKAGLEVLSVESLRPHYVRTIRAWLENLERGFTEAEAILGPERARSWRLYLAGGALAFEEGRMGVDQILAARRS
ncbi:MAG TPA: cyclopropane-fatty-acyl-phospholipid synthase family protein [Trebonia sp.]|nr:cyclopropane-fatty-acyl-phospholipid synthase family protein [Trebonia sp.]